MVASCSTAPDAQPPTSDTCRTRPTVQTRGVATDHRPDRTILRERFEFQAIGQGERADKADGVRMPQAWSRSVTIVCSGGSYSLPPGCSATL
jgi:hypothetical protein